MIHGQEQEKQTEIVDWLWYPYIARGGVTVLEGETGVGASYMMTALTAEISRGELGPASSDNCMKVIYLSDTDSVADTIKPRLTKFGAVCDRIAYIEETNDRILSVKDIRLKQALREFRPCMLVIDAVDGFINSAGSRQLFKELNDISILAYTYNCALVLITPLRKSVDRGGKNHGIHQIEKIQNVQSVLRIQRDVENDYGRKVEQIKNSLAPLGKEIGFEITPSSGFRWLSREFSITQKTRSQWCVDTRRTKAVHLIREMLSGEDKMAATVYEKLQEAGIGHRTAEQARELMGIRCYRKARKWFWSLH